MMNEWFGFTQKTFTKKGKYYSTKPLLFYKTSLFLKCNLVDSQVQPTIYKNQYSDILCDFEVDDGKQVKYQIYETNITKKSE